MGFLDDLKKQAEQLKSEGQTLEQRKALLDAAFEAQIKPKMEKIFLYLTEMSDNLNTIRPNTEVSYQLKGYGDYGGLKQNEYIMGSYDRTAQTFFLRIICATDRKVRFEIKSESETKEQHDFFWKYNIPFKWKQINNSKEQFLKAVFELQGQVYIELNFKADYDSSTIQLNLRNFPELGQVNYILPPAKIDDTFLDGLAMYLTRMSSTDVLRPYTSNSVWGKVETDPKQMMRARILEEMKAQEKNAPPKPASSPQKTPPVSATETEKKGLLGHLFGKKS